MLSLVTTVGITTYALSDEAVKLVESLPAAAQKFRPTINVRQGGSTLGTVQKAATQIEQAAQETATPATTRGVMRVVVEPARFNIKDYLWTGTIGLTTLSGQITVWCFRPIF